MPTFNYVCSASPVMKTDAEGGLYQDGHETHAIEVPQERVDAEERHAEIGKMGRMSSAAGEPPSVVFCDQHRGWATLA